MVNGSPRRRCENSRTASESARYQASDSTQAIRHLCRGGRQSPFSQRDVALPTEGRGARVVGRVGAELTAEAGREAARVAALNVLASQVFGVTRYGDTVSGCKEPRINGAVSVRRVGALPAGPGRAEWVARQGGGQNGRRRRPTWRRDRAERRTSADADREQR